MRGALTERCWKCGRDIIPADYQPEPGPGITRWDHLDLSIEPHYAAPTLASGEGQTL
jgi:hypothetical protein